MSGESQTYGPAEIVVRRSSSWWPRRPASVWVDRRRVGYVAAGKSRSFRVEAGRRVVSVRFGGTWAQAGPVELEAGRRVEFACGRRAVLPDEGWVVLRAIGWFAGMFLFTALGGLALPTVQGAAFEGLASLPLHSLEVVGYWLVRLGCTRPVGWMIGALLWYPVAWPLGRIIRADHARRYYLAIAPGSDEVADAEPEARSTYLTAFIKRAERRPSPLP